MISFPAEALTPAPSELRARLGGVPDGRTAALAADCLRELRAAATPLYCFRVAAITRTPDGDCDLGFGALGSRQAARLLENCREAAVLAVTLGHGADRLLRQAALLSPARHLVADAVASALAEALCDAAQAALPMRTGPRFSPGYGDLPLSVQGALLRFAGAERDMTLTESGLMLPAKSITAVMGVLK